MSNSSFSQPVSCPDCGADNSRFDCFCGICGAALARLRWQDHQEEWRSDSGRLAVADGEFVRVVLENDGVVPVALILREGCFEELPGWLEADSLDGRVLRLEPGGGREEVELPVSRQHLGAGDRGAELDLRDFEAELVFLTSLASRLFHLTLVLARKPWISPAGSLYRFIPVERLRGEGIEHVVEIHNDAATRVEIRGVEILDDDQLAPPDGYDLIELASLIWLEEEWRRPLEPAERRQLRLRLRSADITLPQDRLGFFSGWICFDLAIDDKTERLKSRLTGALGRGPTLELEGSPVYYENQPDSKSSHSFTFKNSGQLPVELLSIEILRRRDESEQAHPSDWLVLEGLKPGEQLAPGETRELKARLRPISRPADELEERESSREIRLHHDGWQEPDARLQKLEVTAAFGRAELRTLGIDFGTTNSVACLMGLDRGYPLVLEILKNDERKFDSMASLMYFDEGLSSDSDADCFRFGEAARGSAGVDPANLVRSIKSVVVEGARAEYRFWRRHGNKSPRRVRMDAQDLLNIFIRQIRERAERGVTLLSGEVLREENLEGRRVAFRNAAFSHPVEISSSMKQALMAAAHAAGINSHNQEPADFFDEWCVDEATAAVLAWIDSRLAEENPQLEDLERVVCFDMGGGTTDVAAVEVRDMARYQADETEATKVMVELCSKTGDSRFAGDRIDQLLAKRILAEIEAQSQKRGAPVKVTDVLDAILAPSFAAFQDRYLELLKHDPSRAGAGRVNDAYSVWDLAVSVLKASEEAKRDFSKVAEVTKTIKNAGWIAEVAEPGQSGDNNNFKVLLKREWLEEILRDELGKRTQILDNAVADAGWEWSSVTTFLFTGQSVRSPSVRKPILDHLRSRLGEEGMDKLHLVEPDGNSGDGFDPKLCVAIGAAIWGLSKTSQASWLVIKKSLLARLSFSLTQQLSRHKFVAVKGLERGVELPAKAKLSFENPRNQVVLCRDRKKFVEFQLPEAAKDFTIEVENLADFWIIVGDKKYRGELIR